MSAIRLNSQERLSFATRINGLQEIIGKYADGLMPINPKAVCMKFHPPKRGNVFGYHGLGTMLLGWVDAKSDLGATRDWIEPTVVRSQLANGTWFTYGELIAPCLNGITPSTAYAVLALTAKDRRLPFLQRK